jgi:hypothetical protein
MLTMQQQQQTYSAPAAAAAAVKSSLHPLWTTVSHFLLNLTHWHQFDREQLC